jgi:hypothetical protein
MLTRRGILQRAAAVVGLVGAAEVSGIIRLRPSSEKSPPRPVKPPQNREYPNVRGLYSKRQVNVCYAPVRIVRGEPEARRNGKDGLYLRKGPSFDAEPTIHPKGHEVVVPRNEYASRQSARSAPGRGCPPPKLREPVNGWIWCTYGKSGWLPLEVEGVRYVVDDLEHGLNEEPKRYLGGPANRDFDCRAPEASKRFYGYRCGGPRLPPLDFSEPREMVVADFGSPLRNSQEDFYLRLTFDSTAFHWMVPGDRVIELTRAKGYSYGVYGSTWSFIEVREGRYTPTKLRGWMLQSGLRSA